jgi:hypothetical protein
MSARYEFPFPPRHPPPLRPQLRPDPLYVHVPPRWEYRELVRPQGAPPTVTELNALGDEGWELVNITPVDDDLHCYFKRERPA